MIGLGSDKKANFYVQDICIYLEAMDNTLDFEHFKCIKIFDSFLVSLVKEEGMQRFLPCPVCMVQGKDRYFFEVGPGFEPLDSMEFCQSLNDQDLEDEESYNQPKHKIDEKQKSLIRENELKVVTLNEFLKDGIQKIEKTAFRDLDAALKVGDQIWIYRDRSSNPCNPVSALMPYAHVAVFVGLEDGQKKVIHVTKASICDGIMTATIKKDSIDTVIHPDDQGNTICKATSSYFASQFSSATRFQRTAAPSTLGIK